MGKWEPSPEAVRARLGTMFTKLFVAWSIQQVAVPIVVCAVAFGVMIALESSRAGFGSQCGP